MAKKKQKTEDGTVLSVRLYRPDRGVEEFPEDEVENLIANGEWVLASSRGE